MSSIEPKKRTGFALFHLKRLTMLCLTMAAVAAADRPAAWASAAEDATWTVTIDRRRGASLASSTR